MATMYSVFFGILLTAVCGAVGPGDGFIVLRREYWVLRSDKRVSLPAIKVNPNNSGIRTPADAGAGLLPRARIIGIASAELGVREATGRNDGKRVEEYLAYTNLGKGYEWCAAFVSWCYGQAGLSQPRNPWSPALFPNARTYWKQGDVLSGDGSSRRYASRNIGTSSHDDAQSGKQVQPADVFGIYGRAARRINHVGLVKEQQGKYVVTIEGNSNDRVESRRRHLSTIYALADWVE